MHLKLVRTVLIGLIGGLAINFAAAAPVDAAEHENTTEHVADQETNQEMEDNGAWMIVGIVFMLLFAVSLIVTVYLCLEQRRRVRAFYRDRQEVIANQHRSQRQRGTVASGGGGYF